MTAADNSNGRATLRDVYDSQEKTRQELAAVNDNLTRRIDMLADRIGGLVVAHEHRLTEIETTQTDHSRRLDDHADKLELLESAHNRALGHIGAWKIVAGLAGTSCCGLIVDLIVRAIR